MAEKQVPPVPPPAEESYQAMVSSYLVSFVTEVFQSPMNMILVAIMALLVFKIFRNKTKPDEEVVVQKELPKLRRNFTVAELREYNGTRPDGRILVAVNGSVYDVTKGSKFYGPWGPYAAFGGRDASRGLATFSVVPGKDEWDDLSDLSVAEMNSVREWEEQFKEQYDYVGKLLEFHDSTYSDEEEADPVDNEAKSKND